MTEISDSIAITTCRAVSISLLDGSPKGWALRTYESLWGRDATRARGCTCGGTDVRVEGYHRLGCGEPSPDEIKRQLTEAFAVAMERASSSAVVAIAAECRLVGPGLIE